jgi:hypothetical protein
MQVLILPGEGPLPFEISLLNGLSNNAYVSRILRDLLQVKSKPASWIN